jgi:hypothetical protein
MVMVYVITLPTGACDAVVDFTIETSAAAGAAVTPEEPEVELPPLPSLVALVTPALLTIEPLAPDATSTTSVNVRDAPFASEAAVQVIVPVAPTAGVVQVNGEGWVIERKSSEDGSVSVMTTFAAASGPLFVTTIVYE